MDIIMKDLLVLREEIDKIDKQIVDLYEKMKVPKGVISNLENEYEISKKILKINEKKEKILFEKENVTSI